MTQRASSATFILCSVLLAWGCDPKAQTVGAGLPGDGVGDSDDESWDEEWRVSGAIGAIVLAVAATPDGGVAALEQSPSGYVRLRRYTADGAEVLSVRLQGLPDVLVAAGDELVVAGSRTQHDTVARASVWRLSGAGEVLASYEHPRPGTSNSFGLDVAVQDGEVALLVGNWGTRTPDETQFEVVRLSADLEPLAEPIQFTGWIEDVEFAPDGGLLALETNDDGPDMLHRIGAAGDPASVECQTLLSGDAPPMCASSVGTFSVTNIDTGETFDFGTFGFQGYAKASRAHAIVFAGTVNDGQALRVAEVIEDGTLAREAEIPMSDEAAHVLPGAASRGDDGAVYVTLVEDRLDSLCEDSSVACLQSHLVRLAPDE